MRVSASLPANKHPYSALARPSESIAGLSNLSAHEFFDAVLPSNVKRASQKSFPSIVRCASFSRYADTRPAITLPDVKGLLRFQA